VIARLAKKAWSMRRILLVLAVAAMVVAMLGVSAGPALADHRDHRDRFGDRDFFGVLDKDDDNGFNDGRDLRRFDNDDDDDFSPICGDADLEPELILGFGFVCIDEDDLDDLQRFDDDDLDDLRRFDDNDFADLRSFDDDSFGERFLVG